MKTIIPIIFVALLCGCSNKVTEQRIAELEARRMETETRVGQIERTVTNLLTAQESQLDTIKALISQGADTRFSMTNIISEFNRLDDLVRSTHSQFSRPYIAVAAAQQAKAAGMSNGVPVSVYNTIRTAAAKEYPTDFAMQDYTVRRQLEAYRKLHP